MGRGPNGTHMFFWHCLRGAVGFVFGLPAPFVHFRQVLPNPHSSLLFFQIPPAGQTLDRFGNVLKSFWIAKKSRVPFLSRCARNVARVNPKMSRGNTPKMYQKMPKSRRGDVVRPPSRFSPCPTGTWGPGPGPGPRPSTSGPQPRACALEPGGNRLIFVILLELGLLGAVPSSIFFNGRRVSPGRYPEALAFGFPCSQ